MINIQRTLLDASENLKEHSPSARLDVEILLAHTLRQTRSYLYTNQDKQLTPSQAHLFQTLFSQRKQGKPIAYLIGTKDFWSMTLKVTKDTLIPRPETELLLELSLELLRGKPNANILELGTGTGAIALALALERPTWQITATDYSKKALKIAEENAALLNLTKISFCYSNWFQKIAKVPCFDAIISNPPYIALGDPHLLDESLCFEPKLALLSGNDGLKAIKHIIKHSVARLKPNGLLLLEHGYNQKSAVLSILSNYGYKQIRSCQDWQGNDRVCIGTRTK